MNMNSRLQLHLLPAFLAVLLSLVLIEAAGAGTKTKTLTLSGSRTLTMTKSGTSSTTSTISRTVTETHSDSAGTHSISSSSSSTSTPSLSQSSTASHSESTSQSQTSSLSQSSTVSGSNSDKARRTHSLSASSSLSQTATQTLTATETTSASASNSESDGRLTHSLSATLTESPTHSISESPTHSTSVSHTISESHSLSGNGGGLSSTPSSSQTLSESETLTVSPTRTPGPTFSKSDNTFTHTKTESSSLSEPSLSISRSGTLIPPVPVVPIPEPAIWTALGTTIVGGIGGGASLKAIQSSAILLSTCYANQTTARNIYIFYDLKDVFPELGSTGGLVFMGGLVILTMIVHITAVLILMCCRKCCCCKKDGAGRFEAHPEDPTLEYDVSELHHHHHQHDDLIDDNMTADVEMTTSSARSKSTGRNNNNNNNNESKYQQQQQPSFPSPTPLNPTHLEEARNGGGDSVQKQEQLRQKKEQDDEKKQQQSSPSSSFSRYWDEACATLGFPGYSIFVWGICFPGIVVDSSLLTLHKDTWYNAYGYCGLLVCLIFLIYIVVKCWSVRSLDLEGEEDDDDDDEEDEDENTKRANSNNNKDLKARQEEKERLRIRKAAQNITQEQVDREDAAITNDFEMREARVRERERLHTRLDQVKSEQHDAHPTLDPDRYNHNSTRKSPSHHQHNNNNDDDASPVKQIFVQSIEQQQQQSVSSPVVDPFAFSPRSSSPPSRRESSSVLVSPTTASRGLMFSNSPQNHNSDPRMSVVLQDHERPKIGSTAWGKRQSLPTSLQFSSQNEKEMFHLREKEIIEIIQKLEDLDKEDEAEEKRQRDRLSKITFWPAPHFVLLTYRYALYGTNCCSRIFMPKGIWNTHRRYVARNSALWFSYTPFGATWFPSLSYLFIMIVALVSTMSSCYLPILIWAALHGAMAMIILIFRPCRYVIDNFFLFVTFAGAAMSLFAIEFPILFEYNFEILYGTIGAAGGAIFHPIIMWFVETFKWKPMEIEKRFPCKRTRDESLEDVVYCEQKKEAEEEFNLNEQKRIAAYQESVLAKIMTEQFLPKLDAQEQPARILIEVGEEDEWETLMKMKPVYSAAQLQKAKVNNELNRVKQELEEKKRQMEMKKQQSRALKPEFASFSPKRNQ